MPSSTRTSTPSQETKNKSAAAPVAPALAALRVIEQPYSTVTINRSESLDHAAMRARQLAALLIAIQPPEGQCDLLWLAQQMADELVAAVAQPVAGDEA